MHTCIAKTTCGVVCADVPQKVHMLHLLANLLPHTYMRSHDYLVLSMQVPPKGVYVPSPGQLARSCVHAQP